MEQVKRDIENDEKLKKDFEKVQHSSHKIRQRSAATGETLDSLGENLRSVSSKTSEILSRWRESVGSSAGAVSNRMSEASEQNEALKKAREFMKSGLESTSSVSSSVFSRTKDAFSGAMDKSNKVFSYISDEDKKAEKLKQWKAARDQMAAAEAAAEAGKEAAGDSTARSTEAPPEEHALVVSKESNSSWDRFGAGLRDMPFLSSVFENPLFERLFGESEIAASIREMKELDYNFYLEEFAEDMEYVIAPHIIKAYLEGDSEALKRQCGEAAFNAVNASIKERKRQKLSLDTKILAGPKEVELKGAKLMEQGPPCFIWTFTMQQVNCLRDHTGEIIEGAVDDIRTVCYAMAVTRHPDTEQPGLEYPWQISELAILWNQPCF